MKKCKRNPGLKAAQDPPQSENGASEAATGDISSDPLEPGQGKIAAIGEESNSIAHVEELAIVHKALSEPPKPNTTLDGTVLVYRQIYAKTASKSPSNARPSGPPETSSVTRQNLLII